jgi:O-antigen ligase
VYLGLTAVFELAGVNSLVFPSYINNAALGIHGGRARGPFLEAGADGLAMFASAVAAVMLISKTVDRRVQRLLGLVAALCVLGIVLTLTRQVWAGCAIGAALAAALSPRLRRYVPITAVSVALIAGGALVAIPSLQAKLSARAADQSSIWDRLNSDAAALRMFEQKPVLGFGWGEFPSQSVSYYHVAASYPLSGVAEVHNVVLSNAAELGAIGLGLWLVALGVAFAAPFFRRGPPELDAWKLGLVAVAVAWFVQSNFAPVSYAFDNYMPWLFAGVAMGPVWKFRSQAARSQRREDLAG